MNHTQFAKMLLAQHKEHKGQEAPTFKEVSDFHYYLASKYELNLSVADAWEGNLNAYNASVISTAVIEFVSGR